MNGQPQPQPEQSLNKRQRWELKQQQKAQARQQHVRKQAAKKYLPWLIGGVVVVLLGLGLWRNAGQPSNGSGGTATDGPLTVTAEDWVKGAADAAVTLVEYSDFQCPACAAYFPVVKQLLEAYPEKLRVVYRHFPLTTIHRNAIPAAQAAEAAGRQGQFWAMHDLLFENQKTWANARNVRELFRGYAEELKLDPEQFIRDYDDPAVREQVDRDRRSGDRSVVRSTPSFFLNGKYIDNPGSLDGFKALIDAVIAAAPLPTASTKEVFHAHADLMVYVNGKALDLSQPKFQSTNEKELDHDVHLHGGKATVVHLHERGVTLAQFFKSLGMAYTPTCLTLDDGKKYCTDNRKSLKLFVNGLSLDDQFGDYQPQDLDRILISYGSETTEQIQKQLDSVPDEACIYSETCPERGEPPTEECVGGLGTGCDE